MIAALCSVTQHCNLQFDRKKCKNLHKKCFLFASFSNLAAVACLAEPIIRLLPSNFPFRVSGNITVNEIIVVCVHYVA